MEAASCRNCGNTFTETYCPKCGQHIKGNKRLVFFDIIQDFFDNVFNLHKGFFYTVWKLLSRPGQVGRDFLEGKRKIFTSPVRYLVIAIAVQAFVDFFYLRPDLEAQPDFFTLSFLSEEMNRRMAVWNHLLATRYTLIHNVASIITYPIAFYFLFRGMKYNFTEFLATSFYYSSTALFFILSCIIGYRFFTGGNLPIPVVIFLNLVYIYWAYFRFFNSIRILERSLKIILSILFFMVFRVLIMVYLLSAFVPLPN